MKVTAIEFVSVVLKKHKSLASIYNTIPFFYFFIR